MFDYELVNQQFSDGPGLKYVDGLGAGVVGCLTVYLPLLWGMAERYSKLLKPLCKLCLVIFNN